MRSNTVVIGLPALQRAVSRGELAERLAAPHPVNWFFSGAAMSLLLVGYGLEPRRAVLVFTMLGLLICAPVVFSFRGHRKQ